jgi:CheY-like chemotaxis protein
MGGRIWVESCPGSGSSFHVTVTVELAEAAEQTSGLQMSKTAALQCPPLTALIAEDEEINRRFLTALLGKLGCSVIAVENGQQALDTWRKKKFDLLLMDIQMPVMDGIEAIKLLREEEADQALPHTPAIALTAHTMQGYRQTLLEAGMDGYVSKPVTIPTLLSEIERVRSERSNECRTV